MASTGSYQGPDGKDYWEVRWREGTKQPRSKRGEDGRRFRTEKQAKKYGEDREVLYRRGGGKLFDRDASVSATVAQYAWIWFESRYKETVDKDGKKVHYRTPGSKRWTEGMIRNHIDGTSIADVKLTELTKPQIESWLMERSVFGGGTLANSTLKMALGLLRAIYATAMESRLVDKTPVPGNKSVYWHRDGEKTPGADTYVSLSVDQVYDLADAFPARYRVMPLVQAGLGLRIGEVLALREEDVDFPNKVVKIDWQFNDTEKKRGQGPGGRARPKSNHSRRIVPLPDEVADVIRDHMAEFPPGADGSLFTTTTHARRPHAHGQPMSHQYYGQQLFKRAMRKAGLPECSSHDLRHHYATELLYQGVRHETVAKYLGHADAGLVISTYGHDREGTSDDVRDAIGRSWGERKKRAARHLKVV